MINWSIIEGVLPAGLTLNAGTGEIIGRPTVYGDFDLTVKVENDCGDDIREVEIFVCGPPQITTNNIDFVFGANKSVQLELIGTPGTWSIINNGLPNGLSFNTGTGVVSGTPTEFGDFSFTVKHKNICGETTKEISLFVCVLAQITSSNSMNFVMGSAGSTQLTSSGTPGTWSIVGSLPTGLSLNSNTGVISGTPTVSGNFTFTVKLETHCSEVTQLINMSVCAKPSITSSSSMNCIMNEPVSFQLTSSGTPGTWSIVGSLPTGLSLNSNTGVISGTPTVFGEFTFVIKVENSCGENSQGVSMVVCVKPQITSTNDDVKFEINEPVSKQLSFYGMPVTWSVTVGSLPTGLSLSSSGIVTGTPTVAGNFNVTLTITNSCGTANKEFIFEIENTVVDVYQFDINSNYKLFGTSGGTETIQVTSTLNSVNHPWKYV